MYKEASSVGAFIVALFVHLSVPLCVGAFCLCFVDVLVCAFGRLRRLAASCLICVMNRASDVRDAGDRKKRKECGRSASHQIRIEPLPLKQMQPSISVDEMLTLRLYHRKEPSR